MRRLAFHAMGLITGIRMIRPSTSWPLPMAWCASLKEPFIRSASAHGRASAGAHSAIACPPCAQSTITTLADFKGERSATCLNRENSWVAFDMLMATKPITPCSSGSPSALSGRILASSVSASLRWASGGEVASHQFVDLTDKSGTYGVTILTDCKNASDKPNENTLRLTLVRTPGTQGGYTDQGTQDLAGFLPGNAQPGAVPLDL